MEETSNIIWNEKTCRSLNIRQRNTGLHPLTCGYDGDQAHIEYEFSLLNYPGTLEDYKQEGLAKGYMNPLGALTETPLMATPYGWVCPVCDYTQSVSATRPMLEEMPEVWHDIELHSHMQFGGRERFMAWLKNIPEDEREVILAKAEPLLKKYYDDMDS